MEPIDLLLLVRKLAKDNQDFGLADRLRDEIKNIGVIIADSKEGQVIVKDRERIAELESKLRYYESMNYDKLTTELYALRRNNEYLKQEAFLHKNMRELAEKKLRRLHCQ